MKDGSARRELAVHADYGMSVSTGGAGGREAALRFALFVMSPEAQRVIGMYGFTPVAERRADLPSCCDQPCPCRNTASATLSYPTSCGISPSTAARATCMPWA